VTNIVCTDHHITSGRAGLSLLLRNKRVSAQGRPVLFVHGATYPSTVTFDYALDGESWMDNMARAGFDAWCIDLLGYGGSDRPAEMSQPAAGHGPLVATAEAVADVKRAVDFILASRAQTALDLIGYSWGTAIAGQVAGECPQQVCRLVLAGALWLRAGAVQIAVDGPLGAYRLVSAAATVQRWTYGIDAAQMDAIGSSDSRATWAQAAVASDPAAGQHSPPLLRAPTGVVQDLAEYWLKDQPTYAPSQIRCPTLVVVGEWDQETTPAQAQAVFAQLTASDTRRLIVIGGATHLMLLERQRQQLFREVAGFLSE
jgi:pimeloyl-ACP methyl ester carboxylesterase